MIFTHYSFQTPMCFDNNVVHQLIIEDPDDAGRLLCELNDQIGGMDGSFSLSDRNLPMDLRAVSLIIDPFNLDWKDVNAGLLKQLLHGLTEPEHLLETDRILSEMQTHVLAVATGLESDADIEGTDLKSMIKSMGLHLSTGKLIEEQIPEYVRLSSRYGGKKLFIVVNLSTFVSAHKFHDLIRQLEYNQIPTILVESNIISRSTPVKVIDTDFCEINLEP